MARTRGFLRAPVGAGARNEHDDVVGVKQRLRELGFYAPDGVIDDTIDKQIDRAIQSFQERAGLRVDGTINPDGETLKALREAVAERPENHRGHGERSNKQSGEKRILAPPP